MRDGMKSNPEASLLRALAEFADETSLETASDRVRRTLQREVHAKARRRWAIPALTAALAAAAALAAVIFGVSTRSGGMAAKSAPQAVARDQASPAPLGKPTTASAALPEQAPIAEARPATVRRRSGPATVALAARSRRSPDASQAAPAAEWRKGEVVLSPWYFNTALPPSARSVLVRSEVDARTAMRFGVASAGDTAPVEILFGEDGLPRAMRFVRRLPTQKN